MATFGTVFTPRGTISSSLTVVQTLALGLAIGAWQALPLTANAAEQPWQTKLERANVTIFVRSVADSEFLQTKAVATLNASKADVMAMFPKDKGCWQWVARCKKSIVFATIPDQSTSTVLSYTALNMPWPLSDRDLLFQSQQYDQRNETSGLAQTVLEISPADPALLTKHGSPEQQKAIAKSAKKHVRAEGHMTYTVSEISAEQSQLTIIMHTEFGGNAPVRLINGKLVEELLADVAKLQKLLKE